MDNKNKKTFGDLFSSILNEDENNASLVNLGEKQEEVNPFKEVVEEKEQEEVNSFKEVVEEKEQKEVNPFKEVVEEKEQKEVNPFKETVEEKEQEEINPFKEVVEEEKQEEVNPFKEVVEEKEQKEVNPFKETVEEKEQEEINPFKEVVEEEKQEEVNPFKEVVEEEKQEEINPFKEVVEEKEQEEINPFKETVEEKKQEEVNPFMEAVDEKEQEEVNPFMEAAEEKEQEEINPFKEVVEEKEQEEINPFKEVVEEKERKEVNPFMEAVDEKEQEEVNPFMEAAEEKEQEEINLGNVFLNQKDENNVSIIKEESNEEIDLNNPFLLAQNKKEESKYEEKEQKSDSPFFESESDIKTSTENNPLFQNSLYLMENKKFKNNNSHSIDMEKSQHFNVKIVKKKESIPKYIISILSYATFILLLLLGITLLVYVLDIKIRAAKGDYSSPTYNAYVVLTGSMLPKIQVYDVVVTKKVKPEELKKGDIITFASADSRFLGTIITHRIINKNYDAEKKTYTFQTKGDNNNVADNALVPQNNIYGKVFLKIPKLGYLQEFLATRGGWIIVILIPCLVVISYDIVKLAKGLKKKKYKNIKVQK